MPASKDLVSGRKGTEALFCITVATRDEVDKLVEIGAENGGKKDPTTLPEMPGGYARSVEDPDGHIWEIAFMEQMVEKKE
jgi:predicted lactoylglutathione lyase